MNNAAKSFVAVIVVFIGLGLQGCKDECVVEVAILTQQVKYTYKGSGLSDDCCASLQAQMSAAAANNASSATDSSGSVVCNGAKLEELETCINEQCSTLTGS
mmetsp:Transcript_42849/g.68395  ORF Transcript_42849/g.68395 Transcript_42849/m.68395 type:complete len:102 (-) Transcript_42849:357-662(-)